MVAAGLRLNGLRDIAEVRRQGLQPVHSLELHEDFMHQLSAGQLSEVPSLRGAQAIAPISQRDWNTYALATSVRAARPSRR